MTTAFAIIQSLKSEVASLCQTTIGNYLKTTNASNVTSAFLQSLGGLRFSKYTFYIIFL
jgi:hypothetical protein